ncbi:MAG: DUF1902 domain-containing protein [bacterium]
MNSPTRITLSFERPHPGEGMEASYYAVARWDGAQEVWYVESTNIPKLELEAESISALREKIRSYVAQIQS